MRRSVLVPFLSILVAVGCAPVPPSHGTPSTGGQTSASGGSGGSGGAGGTGGTGSSGGTSASGGSGGAGGLGGTVASGGSGGGGGGSAGSGGNSGAGGSSHDAAVDAPQTRDASDSGNVGGGGTANGGSGGTSTGGVGGAGGKPGSGGAGGGSGGSGSGGKPGSGGTAGSGGATGMGGTGPTACSFPSSWAPGSPTYTTYSLPNPATACGYTGSNNSITNIAVSANYAAIPGQSPSNFDTSSRCGACVQIGNAVITIVDECPYDAASNNQPCANNPKGHLDLSTTGASAAGVKGDPALKNQTAWKFVPCPITGNVVVRLKNGNSNEMYIENMILPIQAVTCAGQTGSRTSYGAWHFNSNIPGASCDVTDIAGRIITVTAGSTQGQNVDTGKQFPKCQ